MDHSKSPKTSQVEPSGYKTATAERPAVTLALAHGKVALIDLDDLERVASSGPWVPHWTGYGWYVVNKSSGGCVYLHRFIMRAERGVQIDHRNGVGTDCRKQNLRTSSASQNNANRRSFGHSSSFKGVDVKDGKFRARIRKDHKQICLGTFASAEEAARVYDAKARELHGEFAYLNFPEELNA